jgi:hypothetical protein
VLCPDIRDNVRGQFSAYRRDEGNRSTVRFAGVRGVGTGFAIVLSKPYSKLRSTAMKFETLMLKSLFFACVLAGALTVGSMLLAKPVVANVALSHVASATASAG